MPGLWKGARKTPKRRRDVIGMSSIEYWRRHFPKERRSLLKVTNPGSDTLLTQSRGRGLLGRLFAWRKAGSSVPTVGVLAFRLASRSLTRHQAQGPRGTAPRSTARRSACLRAALPARQRWADPAH